MLKKNDIKNGVIVFDKNIKRYGYIQHVGNAIDKGNRNPNSNPKDELSYSFVNIINGEINKGICEISGKNDDLIVATKRDVVIYFAIKEANLIKKICKGIKKYAMLQDAINKFKKMNF